MGDRMKRVPAEWVRRGAAFCCLAAFLCLAPGIALAGIGGSKHDFTGLAGSSLTPAGACTACHIAHKAEPDNMLWRRSLSEEKLYFDQKSNPNYAPGYTILCYDCHDNHAIVGAVDNDPPDASFNSSRLPQDVAFDDDMKTTIPRDGLNNDGKPGYYENIPSDTAGYPVTGVAASTYISGHYVKNNPGVGLIGQGDKLPCSDCHDPHSTVNQAFIRGNLGGKSLSGKRASTRMAYDTTDRNDDDSRDFCIACHGTSEQSIYQAVAFSAVNPTYGSAIIARPPASISAHLSTKTIACTSCHKHNGISASCTDCHGFPPLLTQAEAGGLFVSNDPVRKYAENYAGGAGAHRRHKEALGDALFQCELCHGPDAGAAAWHNQGGGVFPGTNPGQYVNIMGLRAYWDPDNSRTTDYVGTSNAPPATPITPDPYEFSKTGGGDQRCSGLACHGDPPNTVGALNWTDKMVDDTTGAAVNIEVCKWCHDATPAKIGAAGIVAPNVLGDGLTWGADVSGHGLASGQYDADSVGGGGGRPAANKQCAVCHDATYTTNAAPAVNTPNQPHFGAADKRLRDTLNNQPIGGNPDASCIACHQVSGGPDSPQHYLSYLTSHGNSTADGYVPIESPFSRSCRQCHEVHGSNWNGVGVVPRNLHMLGKWIDANGDGLPTGLALGAEAARVDSNATSNVANIDTTDLPVIVKSSGGTVADDSWNDGLNDGVAESICVVCHVSLEKNHSQRGDTYLQGQGHNVGRECQLCHQHGDLSTRPNKADDAFGPLSCFACHGTPPGTAAPAGQLEGQFWPDGRPSLEPSYSYANDEPGAHRAHIEFIALKVFGETLAQLVTSTEINPGIQSFTKQVEICKFCHYDPGGTDAIADGEAHYANSTSFNSPAGRVNVKQGTEPLETPPNASPYFRKFATGNGPWGGGTNFADDTTGGAYSFVTDSCANLVCHNQSPTPQAGVTKASPGWNTPPDWTAGIDANCSNTSCHAAVTQIDPPNSKASGYHGVHAGPAGRGYACTQCHRNNYNALDLTASLRHQNAQVEMNGSVAPTYVWNGAGSIEGTTGGGDGFYDKDGTGAASAGDTGFAYKNGIYGNTCYNIYCHGADNTALDPPNWGGGTTAPIWNNSATVYCGSCHDANGTGGLAPGGTDVVATGNHTDHLTAVYGPNPGAAAGCAAGAATGCHSSYSVTSTSHADGTLNFLGLDGTTVADFAGTDTCNTCHGASTASARANWANGSYVLPCIECHDATTPANSARTGTAGGGIAAPAKSALWGTRGHGLGTVSRYDQTAYGDAAGNSGAGAVCGNCHDGTSAHISGTLGNTDRLTTVAVGNALCNNCHDGAGAGGALGNAATQVSTHGNRSTTMGDEYTPQRAAFELNCVECHDVHGTANIYMINPVNADGPLVSTLGWPRYYNGVVETATFLFQGAPVAFTANGAGSNYASTAATPNPNKICQTCHTTTGNGDSSGPVYQHAWATTAHGISKCTACHTHDIDQDYSATSQDGFMPLDCDRCHDAAATNPPPAAVLAPKIMANWATSGHGKTGIVAECGDCHDIGLPSSPVTHLDGTVNSVWENGTVSTRNTNTAHLRGEYFTPVTSVGTGAWDVQVTFDNRCWTQCHQTAGALNHRHEVDTAAGANNHWSVEFNTHLTYADGDRGSGIWEPTDWVESPSSDPANAPYPIDCDLTSNANCSGINYAPCISCHDPHGTDVVETGELSNYMLRRKWKGTGRGSYLCRGCHQ